MRGRGLTVGALTALALIAWTSAASGEETIRLGLPRVPGASGVTSPADAPTITLQLRDEDADTVPVWRRWGGGWHGGFHRSYGAYYGGYRPWGYYGGYRPWGYYGGYRPWGYYGGYQPYVSSYYYYAPSYYYAPPVYYYPAPNCFFMSGGADTLGRVTVGTTPRVYIRNLETQPYAEQPNPAQQDPRVAPPRDHTYPYDGGPQPPVPAPRSNPQTDPNPTTVPRQPTIPLEGRAVSLPSKQTTKPVYPAYGENPTRPRFAEDRVTPAPLVRKNN